MDDGSVDSTGNTYGTATPKALMGAGAATSILGQFMSNMDKAQAEAQNADYYRKEAQFVVQATQRQAMLTSQKYAFQLGGQTSAYAKGGVDVGSGSALNTLAGTASNAVAELTAVQRKGLLDYELARSRAGRAQDEADTLRSPEYNGLQAAGSLFSLGSKI